MALWRVRATVVDKPGFLAVLAASLALRSVNILSVGVHVTEAGAVDDFLVDAPESLTEEQLLAAVARGRGRDAWAAPADAHRLVDAPTRALDLATLLFREPAAVGDALAELLDARASWLPDERDYGVAGPRMRVPAAGSGCWLVERDSPDFTPAEYARAQALLAVAQAAAQRPPERAAAVLLLPEGRELTVRRAAPSDLPAVRAMHARCSAGTLRQRYLSGAAAPGAGASGDARLARLLAPARGCTLVVACPGAFTERIVAMANLAGEGLQAELALLVEDAWQRRGIGTALLRRAVGIAADEGFEAVVIHTEAQNSAMIGTLRRLPAPAAWTEADAGVVSVTLRVGDPPTGTRPARPPRIPARGR